MGAWRRIATYLGHWTLRGYGHWAIEEKASGRFVGYSGLWNPEGWPEPEVIWSLTADAHGRGYATEAARAGARVRLSRNLGWRTRVSFIAPENCAVAAGGAAPRRRSRARLQALTITVGLYRHPGPDQLHS